MSKIANDGMA